MLLMFSVLFLFMGILGLYIQETRFTKKSERSTELRNSQGGRVLETFTQIHDR